MKLTKDGITIDVEHPADVRRYLNAGFKKAGEAQDKKGSKAETPQIPAPELAPQAPVSPQSSEETPPQAPKAVKNG